MNTMAGIVRNADWIWRGAMVLLVLGQYYLQSNFLPRSEFVREKETNNRQYQEDKKVWWDRLSKINETISALDITMRVFEANKTIISDHEARIRALERRP
jgi:hypothetical protein